MPDWFDKPHMSPFASKVPSLLNFSSLSLTMGWKVPLPSPGSMSSSTNLHSPTIPSPGSQASLLQANPSSRLIVVRGPAKGTSIPEGPSTARAPSAQRAVPKNVERVGHSIREIFALELCLDAANSRIAIL